LSEVRNLSSDKDPKVRKAAYEAELAAYPKVAQSVAYALNGVKGEVNTLCELRGFESALDQAVYQSRMEKSTLNALIESMKEYLPHFHKYLKRKGELLGHKNGLPYYDIFA
jgi:oligoendopeptidase F